MSSDKKLEIHPAEEAHDQTGFDLRYIQPTVIKESDVNESTQGQQTPV